MEKSKRIAYIQLHVAIFLWGFTAILGDLITLSAIPLVWWRVFFTSISFFFLIPVFQSLKSLSRKMLFRYLGIGVLVAVHWILFFASIKLSNPSIALVCFATVSFFTALLEPLILRTRLKGYEIILGLMILPGMILVVNSTDLKMMNGIWAGIGAALLASIFTVLNKKFIDDTGPRLMTFLEMGAAWIVMSLILPFYYLVEDVNVSFWPSLADLGYLMILAFICTTLAFVLSLMSLKHISAFATNLSINLEPVYGILLAAVFLKDYEELTSEFYFGCGMILTSIFIYPMIKSYFQRRAINSYR
ncbi:MAG: DMT family transporter [Bacteroidia bacterium]|nr:DMT family transporter [Bacteroidia bacterium]